MASSVSNNLSQRFQATFAEASRTTGANFEFLLRTAQRESGMNATAKAPTSSATGLFQFVEQTWLETMKQAGPQLGYGDTAAKITQVGEKYYVRDPDMRQQILDMRKDPKASALLAGAYAKKNEDLLSQRLNRTPSAGELYAAHFLGAQGSGRLIELAQSNPNVDAHKIFPQQARANRNIFFDRQGNAKSISEVYDNLVSTVPEQPAQRKTLAQMLGNLFKPKDSMQQSRFTKVDLTETGADVASTARSRAVETTNSLESFFAEPLKQVPASRYGMSYNSADMLSTDERRSRYALGPDGTKAVEEAAKSVRTSRIFSAALDSTKEVVGAQDTSAMPLPKRKPVTADVYVDSLNGVLPKPKSEHPNGASGRSQETPSDTVQRRFGALDLSSFLDRDVFGSTRNS